MHSSDDTTPAPEKKARWKKCPICWDSIYISETRPVRWFTGQEGERPQEGGDVVLRLIMRQPGSTLALPRDGAEMMEKLEEIPWYFAAEVMDYARIMKGSENYMLEQYETEIEDLQQQEKEDELMFGEESQWTWKAVASILEAKDKVKGIGDPPSAPTQPNERKARRPPIQYHENSESIPEYYNLQHAAKSGQSSSRASRATLESNPSLNSSKETSPNDSSDMPHSEPTVSGKSQLTQLQSSAPPSELSLSSHLKESSNAGSSQTKNHAPIFFYEALLHFYLSPLDIRILKAAFGEFSSFPSTILPRVERISTGHTVDDELRRRAKYLAHLPQGCEVGFLECDWTDVVVPEILAGFTDEITRRQKKNREKEGREEKARVRAEKEEDEKRWASARRKRPSLSHDIISEVDFQALSEPPVNEVASTSSSPPWASSRPQHGSAFASLASPSSSPVAAKTVWGTRMVVPSPPMPAVSQEVDVPENDGWLQDWERDVLEEEDLVAQVEASTLEATSSKQVASSTNSKKKKGKKITLMTTNARRGA